MGGCKPGIGHNLFFRKLRVAIGDVSVDGVREEENVLGGHADVAAQLVKLQLADINPVNQHTSAGYIIKAWNQINQCCFACSC
ncbi:hypothetical protein D3C81_2037300 [compost metagenome]